MKEKLLHPVAHATDPCILRLSNEGKLDPLEPKSLNQYEAYCTQDTDEELNELDNLDECEPKECCQWADSRES